MTTDQKRAYAATFSVHVGLDTGKTFHKLVVRGPDGQRTKAYKVLVCRTGFDAADAHLKGLSPGSLPSRCSSASSSPATTASRSPTSSPSGDTSSSMSSRPTPKPPR